MRIRTVAAAAASATLLAACAWMGGNPMGFFITSANPGKGGDLGGLAGADAYCQKLATAAGAGHRTWHAYLSAAPANGQPAVNARDRIGKGPWLNAKGVQVAANLDELHNANKLTKETNLNERGEVVNGAGDTPNMHDIMTGSNADGTLAGNDMTCGNWTSSDAGRTIVGHHDGRGTNPDPVKNRSWNASHPTAGCSMDALKRTGSAGLFYCFAVN